MCDKHHTHDIHEIWITPENSQRLTSKMVTLFPGQHMHEHSTGPGREEVIVVIYGAVTVCVENRGSRLYVSGEACFIPEDTKHEIRNHQDAPAQYAFVVTKKGVENPIAERCNGDLCAEVPSSGGCPSKHDGWVCSRRLGHSGLHIACAAPYHNLEAWE